MITISLKQNLIINLYTCMPLLLSKFFQRLKLRKFFLEFDIRHFYQKCVSVFSSSAKLLHNSSNYFPNFFRAFLLTRSNNCSIPLEACSSIFSDFFIVKPPRKLLNLQKPIIKIFLHWRFYWILFLFILMNSL